MILAFESGGTKLVAVLTDDRGGVVDSTSEPRPAANHANDTIAQLIRMGDGLLSKSAAIPRAIGFGYGGLVRRAAGSAYLCLHEAGWDHADAKGAFEQHFKAPAFVENDCKAAALAEATLGAGAGARSVFYATMGTGVGGGLVRDGAIAEFHDGGECEIGHLPALPGGPLCGCGGAGCVEAICSGPAMLSLAAGHYLSTPAIFDAWRAGASSAASLVNFCAAHMARALASVMALLHPERIVLGGGVASGNPDYVRLIESLTRPLVVSYFRESFDLRPAKLGELVVSQGAALVAIRNMKSYAQQ